MTYASVTSSLRRRLANGAYKVGDQFLTFEELMTAYPTLSNIYRVRSALAPLIAEGLIESRQGSGTWVQRIPPKVSKSAGNPISSAVPLLEQALTDLTKASAGIQSCLSVLADADQAVSGNSGP